MTTWLQVPNCLMGKVLGTKSETESSVWDLLAKKKIENKESDYVRVQNSEFLADAGYTNLYEGALVEQSEKELNLQKGDVVLLTESDGLQHVFQIEQVAEGAITYSLKCKSGRIERRLKEDVFLNEAWRKSYAVKFEI
jgi:hypothetical protein